MITDFEAGLEPNQADGAQRNKICVNKLDAKEVSGKVLRSLFKSVGLRI